MELNYRNKMKHKNDQPQKINYKSRDKILQTKPL